MKKSLYKFRNDLRNGLTIAEACTKHNITFKYAVDNMERQHKPKRRVRGKSRRESEHIYRNGENYTIYKSINSRSYNFGTYRTVEDAIKVRNYFYEHGWDRKELDKVCQDLNIMRR